MTIYVAREMSLCLTLYVAREMSLCSTLYVAREMSLSLTLYEVAKTVSVSLEVQISVCLSVCLSVLLQQSSTNVVVVGGQQPGQTVIIEKSVGHLPLLIAQLTLGAFFFFFFFLNCIINYTTGVMLLIKYTQHKK